MSGGRKRAAATVADYTGLAYHLLVVRDGEDKSKPWTASVEELPGFTSQGKTSDEALGGIQSAMEKWISVALEEGREIPEPRSATSHSGRLLLRMPRTLHADLTRASEREGVSLNQFITDVLAAAVVWRAGRQASSPGAMTAPINQAPGVEGLTTEPGVRRRPKRSSKQVTNMALTANFVIVGVAAIVAIIVLILAISR
jgi:predicted RNase H-like HicB family nuclease